MIKLYTQAEILRMLKSDGHSVDKKTMYDRAKKGTLNYYETAKGKFYKYDEVLREFGLIDEPSPPKQNIDYDDKDLQELSDLLHEEALTSVQKIAVTKDFWAAKQNWVKYKREIGDVVPMDEAMSIIEVGVTNFKTKMYSIPQKVKSLYPYIKIDAIDTMHSLIDESFTEFNNGV